MLKIRFLGAAREVTGSCQMLDFNGYRFLIDCGMYQGKRKESFEKNREFGFRPDEVNDMILTHSHIDHSGNIPTLCNKGFEGKVYSTHATKELCSLMLPDSAYVQQKDLEYMNKKRSKKGESLLEPLYTLADAERAMERFVPKNLGEHFMLTENIKAYFLNSGHILGSSMVIVKIRSGERKLKIGFTGDLGRKDLPILRDPDEMYGLDYLIIESTYGGRDHAAISTAQDRLADIINGAYDKGGKVIIPVFAVERAQELLYVLNELVVREKIKPMPIFVDSPLAIAATQVFKRHSECFDDGMMEAIAGNNNPFYLELVKYTREVDESKAINDYKKPCIILSATGMCEAGRILHHLKNNIEDPASTVVFVGYQAMNTLGRKIVEGEKNIKIFGESYRVNAGIEKVDEFSGHAGSSALVDFAKRASGEKMKKIFLVHGEESQQQKFMEELKKEGIENVYNPEPGYTEVLDI
ncbi:MAG: MBL fold metallo-hydrolase RNA specificity domain-containing protein [Candidatus Goldiibacteriota bacterium]